MTADTMPGGLARACQDVRPAGERDAIAGVRPSWVAAPASVQEASAVLRAAAEADLTVMARGSGTKLAWGAPPRTCDLLVDTRLLNQVIEHAAGDMVARVQAGVPMAHLAEVLGRAGQQLALDAAGGTAGGVLATGVAGPRRLRYGTPRDLVIGVTVVRADGKVATSGGKVVKNVAGYDLGKLFAGSYGTLGLIVEAVFRLHPLPASAAYVTVDCQDGPAARAAVAAAASSVLAPTAVEIDRPGRGSPLRVGVLLAGDPASVAERAELMCGLLGSGARTSDTPPAWWDSVAGGPDAGAGTLVRIAFWAAALPGVLAAVDTAGRDAGLDPAVGGSAAAGVLHAALDASAEPAAVAAFLASLREALGRPGAWPGSLPGPVGSTAPGGGAAPGSGAAPAAVADGPPTLASAIVVHAPPGVCATADLWGPVPALNLMRAVKDQFDPGHRMAPGRFAGGI